MKQFDEVRVIGFRDSRFNEVSVYDRRNPQIGDIAYIIDVYISPELAYEVECSDAKDGSTIWMCAMFPDELEKYN